MATTALPSRVGGNSIHIPKEPKDFRKVYPVIPNAVVNVNVFPWKISSILQLNSQKSHQFLAFPHKVSYNYIWRRPHTKIGSMRASLGKESNKRILLSVAEVTRKTLWSVFARKWSVGDISTAVVVFGMHGMCLLAPFTFTWKACGVFVVLYVVTGLLGITLSYHRNLSHRSFKLPKLLEYIFAYCGAHAMQGDPLAWVSTHRYHHQYCDSDKDPHSPTEGFWFSHWSWMFDEKSLLERIGTGNNVSDLKKQPFYRFLQNTYILHPIAMGLFLYSLGGVPFVIWGMAVRIVWVYHITWLVNSACHVWGHKAWNTGDLSTNNWWVAALAFGEGWHNNHHAFEYSARHGLQWWQLDITWYVIRMLEVVGLATDVRLPSEQHKAKMCFSREM